MELVNYRKFKHCAIEFPDGVIGIIGPNGVGKSSLIEAIAWAIYGNEAPIVRTTKEGVLRANAGPNEECRVFLEFEIAGDFYKLERSMKGRDLKVDAKLIVNNKPLAKGDRIVTDELTRILGMDYKAFFISVFARQKDLAALSELQPSERKKLILRMLEIDVLDSVVSAISKDVDSTRRELEIMSAHLLETDGKKKIDKLNDELKSMGMRLNEEKLKYESLMEKLASQEELFRSARAQREAMKSKEQLFIQLNQRCIEKKERLASFDRKRKELEDEIRKLRKISEELRGLEPIYLSCIELEKKREELDRIQQAFAESKSTKTQLDKLSQKMNTIQAEIEDRRKRLAAYKDIESRIQIVERTISEVEKKINDAKSNANILISDIKRELENIEEAKRKRKEIANLGPEGLCPMCERPLGEQQVLLLDKLQREIEQLEKLIREKEGEIENNRIIIRKEEERKEVLEKRRIDLLRKQKEEIKISADIEHLQDELRKCILDRDELKRKLETLGEISFNEAEYEQIKNRIRNLEGEKHRYIELAAQLRRLPEAEKDLTEINERLRIERESLDKIQEQIDSLCYNESEAKAVYDSYDSALRMKQEVEIDVKEKEGDIKLMEFQIKTIEQQIEEIKSQEENLLIGTKKLEQLSALGNVMKAFKENVMARIVPTLSEISSSLFNELTDSKFAGMELDEKYEIYIFDGGERYPISRFSGGEADLANLCLRLAISRVIAERAGSSVNFLILDEIFGSQDQVRKRNIMRTLNQLSKQFNQIILITHIEDIKEFMTHVINVIEKEDGTSEISIMA